MEQLDLSNWGGVFRNVVHRQVFHSERYAEAELSMEEPGLARAQLTTIHTPGINLLQARFQAEGRLEILDPESVESVSSSFILKGAVESTFAVQKKAVRHWDQTHGFQYTPNFQGRHLIPNRELHALSLVYDKAYFKSIAEAAGTGYLDKVLSCMERGETLLVAPGELVLQPRMAELLQAMVQCSFQGVTKYLYLEAKMLELLALQMEQLNAGPRSPKQEWSPADKERFKAVREYLSLHYLEPLTLTGISQQFGLNEFKLKKGFKQLFGSTVFGYIHQLRLQAARQLLSSGQLNVSEAAQHIGYENVSSFSAAFKKHFGYLPGLAKRELG